MIIFDLLRLFHGNRPLKLSFLAFYFPFSFVVVVVATVVVVFVNQIPISWD